MRAIVIASLLTVVIAVVTAHVLPQEEVDLDESSDLIFRKHFKRFGTKIKDIAKQIKLVFHRTGPYIIGLGKHIGRFSSISEKGAGDFFVGEGKRISHAVVIGETGIEHRAHDAYDEAKEEFNKIAPKINYNKVIIELLNMIANYPTQTTLVSLANKAIAAVAGQVAATTVQSFDPLFHTVWKGATHVVKMIFRV